MEKSTTLSSLLKTVVDEGASDLHLAVGSHPTLRVSGSLIPLFQHEKLTQEEVSSFLTELVGPERYKEFLKDQSVDFSYAFTDIARFRGNGFFQKETISIALRLIPNHIGTFAELNLPPVLEAFAQRKQGFFLVVGPVGQGKSTTLASMVELINQTRAEHIVTIEDPIEYLFTPKKSLIEQREIGIDAPDFFTALRSIFRQDVDVIMVGEMRGHETIAAAVTAAETGHLVFSTLHTNTAAQTIDRIIDSFPANQQEQVRVQLAGSLAGILSQRLIPRISGGLIPAHEILINNPAVANLIREGRTHEINTVIQTSSKDGMLDMDRSLAELVQKGEITVEHAYEHTVDPKVFERYL